MEFIEKQYARGFNKAIVNQKNYIFPKKHD